MCLCCASLILTSNHLTVDTQFNILKAVDLQTTWVDLLVVTSHYFWFLATCREGERVTPSKVAFPPKQELPWLSLNSSSPGWKVGPAFEVTHLSGPLRSSEPFWGMGCGSSPWMVSFLIFYSQTTLWRPLGTVAFAPLPAEVPVWDCQGWRGRRDDSFPVSHFSGPHQ